MHAHSPPLTVNYWDIYAPKWGLDHLTKQPATGAQPTSHPALSRIAECLDRFDFWSRSINFRPRRRAALHAILPSALQRVLQENDIFDFLKRTAKLKVAIFLASDKSDKIITYTVFSSEDVGFWPVENIVDLWVIVVPCLTRSNSWTLWVILGRFSCVFKPPSSLTFRYVTSCHDSHDIHKGKFKAYSLKLYVASISGCTQQ